MGYRYVVEVSGPKISPKFLPVWQHWLGFKMSSDKSCYEIFKNFI